jgi:small-conductance mechanosensitive channel
MHPWVALAQAGNSPVGGLGEEFRSLVEELTTTQGRVAVSLAVLILTMFFGVLVAPYLLRRARRTVDERVLTGRLGTSVEVFDDYIPTTFTEVVLRTVQISILVLAALALLIVWGLVDLAITIGGWLVAVTPNLSNVALTLLLLVIAVIGSDQLRAMIARFSDQADRITEHQEEVMLRVGQVTLFVTIGASILTLWGVNLSGLLVGAGFLGIVVGFAARQTLGSMIAGFVLMFSRPFTIGDWVEIGEDEGVVTDITMFNTRLENFDGEFLVLPNDMVTNRTVTNRSQKGLYRIRQDVGIDYEADPEEAMDVAIDAMQDVDEVVDAPAPQVIPKDFGDSSIVLEMRYWIDHPTPPRKWKAISAVVREVKAAFEEAGITIPFPQRTLSDRPEAADEGLVRSDQVDGDGQADGDGEADAEVEPKTED